MTVTWLSSDQVIDLYLQVINFMNSYSHKGSRITFHSATHAKKGVFL